MKRTILLAAVVAVLASAPVHGQPTVTMLDTQGDVGHNAALAIGTDGLPLIAYGDATNRSLKTAHCSDAACTSASLSTVDATGFAVAGSMAIGADGLGIMVYGSAGVKVAHCNDTACTSATSVLLDPRGPIGRPAVTIGADGLPLLAYVRVTATTLDLQLVAAHCSDAFCTSATQTVLREMPYFPGGNVLDTAIVIGQDGLALVAYAAVSLDPGGGYTPDIGIAHCANVDCSAVTPRPITGIGDASEGGLGDGYVQRPSIAIGADGRAIVSYRRATILMDPIDFRVRRCADVACASFSSDIEVPLDDTMGVFQAIDLPVAMGASGRPWLVRSRHNKTRLMECADDSCTSWTESCANANGTEYSLVRGPDGQPLATLYSRYPSFDLGVIHGFGPCLPSVASVADSSTAEFSFFNVSVELDVPTDVECSIQYTTVDGTAMADLDYVPAAGTLTFSPGQSLATASVFVSVLPDGLDEDDEQLQLVLSNPSGCSLGDASATLTIVDDDPLPDVRVGGCAEIEGTGSPTDCVFAATLSAPSGRNVSVSFATQDETATAGPDYTAVSGVLTFAPGTTTQMMLVSVAGDAVVENDETFRLDLGNIVNARLLDSQAQGAILDDDANPTSGLELGHGSVTAADLAAQPGPVADADVYRLAQPALTSWETVVDAVSGDVAPGLVLERLGADQTTVLQSGTPVGTGAGTSLRFQNRIGATVLSQPIRVRSQGCTTDCDAADVYRLRTFDTTGRLARFNNSLSQFTVLILQNPQTVPASVSIDFWSPEGARLATQAAILPPHGVLVLETAANPALQQTSGSVTVTNDAPYGVLTGKAVALEPATGFSFDSPLEYRPR